MTKKVSAIPEGYSSVTPYITISGASDALAFYKKAFGAEEVMCMKGPDGKVMHAEIRIGGSVIMLHDENPPQGRRAFRAMKAFLCRASCQPAAKEERRQGNDNHLQQRRNSRAEYWN
jgi:uncharacterized glyoxalase superfamily protein PhnB